MSFLLNEKLNPSHFSNCIFSFAVSYSIKNLDSSQKLSGVIFSDSLSKYF